MEYLHIITPVIFTIGQTLGVGASTFALLFYIMATQDGTIDSSEKRFMRAVYVILRIGMVVIAIALGFKLLLDVTLSSVYLMQMTLLGVITLNAFLMTKRLISMRIGPVLAGGSWYMLFIISTLPLAEYSFTTLLVAYAVFTTIFYIVFTLLRKKFSR